MSDTSGDSESSVEYDGPRPFLSEHKNAQSAAQQTARHESDSESDIDSSGEEEGEDDELVEQTAMSKKLGYPNIFGIKSEIHLVKAWLKRLTDESANEQVCITKQSIRHYKRILDNMRHRLQDAAPMAEKVSQFMSASVQESIASCFDWITMKVSASEGGALMEEFLAANSFKIKMLEGIEQEVLRNDAFPHANMAALNREIHEIVKSYLKAALITEANERSEVRLQKKLEMDKLKAYEELEKELKENGLTN